MAIPQAKHIGPGHRHVLGIREESYKSSPFEWCACPDRGVCCNHYVGMKTFAWRCRTA